MGAPHMDGKNIKLKLLTNKNYLNRNLCEVVYHSIAGWCVILNA